jgi:extracellular factor (EF) 3-hydroxypalmitic acid methyl ester biosynthesis protein
MVDPTCNTALALLDRVNAALPQTDTTHAIMDELFLGLKNVRESLSATAWRAFSSHCRAHPVKELLHQDPFTARAFAKPQGYPGDARLMDFIYQSASIQTAVNNSTRLGQKIYEYTSTTPAARAVRCRRDVTAHLIDSVAKEVRYPHILSIACGHVDEAQYSHALKTGNIGRYVAFDQDRESLTVVHHRLGKLAPIEVKQGAVQDLLFGKHQLGKFDLVYSLGLFDYLPRAVARMLTEYMFDSLNPGGYLLIANFTHGIQDVGYMESIMGWQLIYRSVAEMAELALDITDGVASQCIFAEENQNVIFLQMRKQ